MLILALPFFNTLAGKALSVPWGQWWFFPLLISAAIVIGVIAGMYPSFYLSAFKPIDVLKGKISRGSRSGSLRSVMVVFQFTTSIILIIGTSVIYRQMNYILNAKLGFNKDQVLMIQGANTLGKRREAFKTELLKLAGVEHVTVNSYLPVEGTNRDQMFSGKMVVRKKTRESAHRHGGSMRTTLKPWASNWSKGETSTREFRRIPTQLF